MDNQGIKTSNFWNNATIALLPGEALCSWRYRMGADFNFDRFSDRFLTPVDKYADLIICAKQCNKYCGFRKILRRRDETFEAYCPENPADAFMIDQQEVLLYNIHESTLVEEIARSLNITPYMAKLSNHEHSWKVGNIIVRGESHSVFFTLQWDTELLELILELNRLMHNPYVLLGSSGHMYNNVVAGCLANGDAVFVPLNETIDFNQDAELEQMRPFSWEKLLLSPEVLAEEPDNIFRRCGDAWEVRFDGGEKFMLLEVDLGAQYIHFLLQNPYENISVLRITSSKEPDFKTDQVSGFDDGFSIISHPDEGDAPFADSVAIGQYRKEERELIQEIENARNAGDNVWQKQLESDLKQIRVAINQAISPAGQYKLLNDPIKNASNSLRNAVNRAIYKIQKYDMNFGSHLKSNIHFGQNIVYSPPERICWEL